MACSRRQFLMACGGTAAALAVGSVPMIGGIATGRKVWMIPELSQALFEKFVGETFEVASGTGPAIPLTLAKVLEAPDRSRRDQTGKLRTETFSAYFEGSPDTALPQGLATFRHPELGEVELFTVPVVAPRPGIRGYEVTINRLLDA